METMSDTTIDELLDMLGERYIMVEHRLINTGMPESNGKHKELQQAKSALYDLILKEVVGENAEVPRPVGDESRDRFYRRSGQNFLRHQQRAKLKELFGD